MAKRGGRKKTGTIVKTRDGRWQAIVTLADGSRKRLKPFEKGTSEAYARERAAYWSEEVERRNIRRKNESQEQPASGASWWSSYLLFRKEKGLTGITGHYERHIKPVLDKHPAAVTVDECKRLRDALDAKAADEQIASKTAFNAWAAWTTACKAAAGQWKKDKAERLKVRDDDPCGGVAPPDLDDPKSLQWLYPDEFIRLMRCTLVPLEWRRRYALATYLYLRGSEMCALSWSDVDVERGIICVRRAYDQDREVVRGTKTGNKGIRRFAIEPTLLPLLRAMHREAGGQGLVIDMPHRKYWACELRRHLKLAGVTRPELFTTDATSKRLRFHDLRSSGLTWLAIRGDDPLKIQQRAGHSTFTTTQKYIRAAEAVGTAIGKVFPPLPESITESITDAQVVETAVEAPGIEPGSARHPVNLRSRA